MKKKNPKLPITMKSFVFSLIRSRVCEQNAPNKTTKAEQQQIQNNR